MTDVFLDASRRFLDLLGPDGVGSEWEQREYSVNGIEPRWVLLPDSVEQCAAALRISAEQGLAVVPAGLGFRLGHGNPPERLDVVLSTSRMTRIVDHAAADLTLVVEAGASLTDVKRQLAAAGQWLPFDPPYSERTTIGGLVAANVSGPVRQAFGTVRESLIGVRAVLADGTVVASGGRVVKNVAGYDLQKLLVGSFGTLGVIVEANFKCRPLPEAAEAIAFTAKNPAPLFALAAAVAGSNVAPELLEVFAGGDDAPVLVVGLAGVAPEVAALRQRVETLAAAEAGVRAGSAAAVGAVGDRLAAISGPVTETDPAVVMRAGTRSAALGSWLEASLAACREAGLTILAHAHAGVGVARLRATGGTLAAASAAIDRLRRSAIAAGGYLVVESRPPSWRLDAWGPEPEGFALMKGVKEVFDPRRLLSPGRFIGGI